jgi:Cu+-exporting ATPase
VDSEAVARACAAQVTKGGYECTVLQVGPGEAKGGVSLAENAAQMQQARQEEFHVWRQLLGVAILLSTPLMILHYHEFKCLHNIGIPFCQETLELLLATLVQVIVGKRYYKAAYKGWINGRFLGMDFLVVLGTTAAYAFALLTYLKHVWEHDTTSMMEATFMTGAMLFTFVTLGKFLESYAKGKTASALQTLMELQPVLALKVDTRKTPISEKNAAALDLSGLETIEISANDLSVGDYLYVLPGSRVPADGVLVATSDRSTHAYIDESALSGEPFPVAKALGEEVFGATVNQLSTLLIRITASGNSTVLAKIVQLIERAQSQKAPIEAVADKVAGVFAPTVIMLSAMTLLGWLIFYGNEDRLFVSVMSAISVVVVACPCGKPFKNKPFFTRTIEKSDRAALFFICQRWVSPLQQQSWSVPVLVPAMDFSSKGVPSLKELIMLQL